ncbi:uncharacterized protein [Haliotis asinina]|uniref:uncharacterized protein n=1 Tax=Haliotis asinina TaxID=109174 RepID=UPI003531CF97
MADLAAKAALKNSETPLLVPYSDCKATIGSYIRDLMHKRWDTQISSTCSLTYCQSNTRCVEKRGVAVCVEDHSISNALELRCATDSECPADSMFVCFTETCKCKPGFSFNPASDSCVRRCNRYGVGFTMYEGLAISGHNDRRIDGKTAKECFKMCMSEKTFTCITYEYELEDGVCQLSKTGYLDAYFFQRESGEQGWIFAVRNCL